MGIGLILFVFALLTGAPRASEVPWYVGETVGEVKIESIQGAVQGQDLKPILRVRAGEDFDPGDLRADVALLVQTGGFAAVEAFVQPMDQIGESDGPARTVVRVVYQVFECASGPSIAGPWCSWASQAGGERGVGGGFGRPLVWR